MRGVLRAAGVGVSAFNRTSRSAPHINGRQETGDKILIKRHQASLRAGLRWVFISPMQKDSSEKKEISLEQEIGIGCLLIFLGFTLLLVTSLLILQSTAKLSFLGCNLLLDQDPHSTIYHCKGNISPLALDPVQILGHARLKNWLEVSKMREVVFSTQCLQEN